jgi:mercuric ion binding protein
MKIAWTLIASLILAANFAVAADSDQTATFDVEKMTCATCPIAVRKAMQRVDGVKEVNVDLDSKTAVVTYDSSVTSTTEIGNASTDVGFPASVRDSE